jgi:hypothetical protein
LNWKLFITQHWKVVVITLSIGLVLASLAGAWVVGDPIDSPFGP